MHNAIEAAIDAQMASDTVQQTIAENVTAQMASDDVQNMISAKAAEQMQTESIQTTISEYCNSIGSDQAKVPIVSELQTKLLSMSEIQA